MLNKLSYNQIKLFRFVASIVLICVYLLDIAAKTYLPKTLLIILVTIAVIFYIVSNYLFIGGQRKNKKVIMDELTTQNEAKAARLTQLLLTIAVFAGIMLTYLTDKNITLNYEVLFCILIAISTVSDGCYLYLEGRVGKDADTDDED